MTPRFCHSVVFYVNGFISFITGHQIWFVANLLLVIVCRRRSIQHFAELSRWTDHRPIVSLLPTSVQSSLRRSIRCPCCRQRDWTLSDIQLWDKQWFVRLILSLRDCRGHSSSTSQFQFEYIQYIVLWSVCLCLCRFGCRCSASPFDSRCSSSSPGRRTLFSSFATSSDIGHFACWSHCSGKLEKSFLRLTIRALMSGIQPNTIVGRQLRHVH